jgi:hypothetical protein
MMFRTFHHFPPFPHFRYGPSVPSRNQSYGNNVMAHACRVARSDRVCACAKVRQCIIHHNIIERKIGLTHTQCFWWHHYQLTLSNWGHTAYHYSQHLCNHTLHCLWCLKLIALTIPHPTLSIVKMLRTEITAESIHFSDSDEQLGSSNHIYIYPFAANLISKTTRFVPLAFIPYLNNLGTSTRSIKLQINLPLTPR